MIKRFGFQVCVLVTMLWWSSFLVFGQSDRATVTGTVSDSSGAVLQSAAVTITSSETGAIFTTVTNNVGIYTIPSLPIGVYSLQISESGFMTYKRTGISLIASQVLQLNAKMAPGSVAESVTVTGAPIEETETSTVAMTMEETAIRELPLNAQSGRDATNLLLATSPNVGAWSSWTTGQSWLNIAGGEQMSNSIFVDGVNATVGNQGNTLTPGLEALQEMQLQTNITDVELSASGGGAITYVLKSGTNQFHGSAFEFLQNEDLNANSWSSNQWLTTCAPGDSACRAAYSRQKFRFNDFGGSLGGPIWKNHTFVFGDFEYYKQQDWRENPTGSTVPTAAMLGGDFSSLLTSGTRQGTIMDGNGNPWINPCTGLAYQYGQIFDPSTSQVIGGVQCATPFTGNIIPNGRISNVSRSVAAIFTKYYAPTVNRITGGNFPSLSSSTPQDVKKTFDVKIDHYFSDRHHLSGSFDLVNVDALYVYGPFYWAQGPFASTWDFANRSNKMIRAVDNYAITPTLLNTFSAGWGFQPSNQAPINHIDTSAYGFKEGSTVFPKVSFGGSVNGVGFNAVSGDWDLYMKFHSYNYKDTLVWQRGRHSVKLGGEWLAQQLNAANYSQKEQDYNFASSTGGPQDPGLTPWTGSGMASFLLGDVASADLQQRNGYYPRQKSFALFAQDDFKVKPKLTLNLGMRWDVTLPGHMSSGQWENFDLTATNPNWAPVKGAWEFSNGSGTTFEQNITWHQFGPHIGGAYQITNKLVARGSYGMFYVPLSAFSSGAGDYYPANQDPLAVGVNQVQNTVAGSTVFNWDSGYPGTTVMPAQNSSATVFGDLGRPMYIHPDMLQLGHTQTFYTGFQYELAHNMLLDARYVGNRGSNLHDYGRSTDQTWPSWSAYEPLLASGNEWNQINNAGDAANAGVPYPYAGYSGMAYATLSPYPQVARLWDTVETVGDPAWNSVSAYNSFVAELKVRNSHGLYVDWSYTLSKQTTNQNGLNNFSNNWGSMFQSEFDSKNSAGWIYPNDRRHLAKGYATYDLPFGKNQLWLSHSGLVNYVAGGWTLGYYGAYGSGFPLGPVGSTTWVPFYYAGARATFANGATAYNMKNKFHGHLDLIDPQDSSNNDFNTASFTSTPLSSPFGNTPHAFNHWRWNSEPSNENLSLMKHFAFGPDNRYRASLRCEFYNAFNRHYYNNPDLGLSSPTYGQITGTWGNRVGQLGARFDF